MSSKSLLVFAHFVVAAVFSAVPLASQAADYPIRPIRLVVGYPPGGPNDIIARAVAQELGKTFGQSVIVDNRGGASGNISAEVVARSAPDGYTLLMETSTLAANATLFRKLSYDLRNDFTHIAYLAAFPQVIVANPKVPANNVRELVALAKAKPDGIAYASGGAGGGAHLATELLDSMAGIRMLHVPYKGTAPGLMAVVGGEVQLMFSAVSPVMPYIKTGQLKALGISSSKRVAMLPDVPTVAESGFPGYEVLGWLGISAPAGTPEPIVTKLNAALDTAIKSPRLTEYLDRDGWQTESMSPERYAAFVGSEIDKWGKVITATGAQAD